MAFIPEWFTVKDSMAGQMFGALYQAPAPAGSGPADPGVASILAAIAGEFSPRIEICAPREIVLDLSGLSKLFGDARAIAEEIRRTAADRLRACPERSRAVRVAIAGSRTAARLLVRHRAGLTIVEPGREASVLAALPLALLEELGLNSTPHIPNPKPQIPNPKSHIPNQSTRSEIKNQQSPYAVVRRWGLRTLGELAALPPDEVMTRLGLPGIEWQRLARGEDARPLVPAVPEERFEQSLELEWPIEGLEPLSFVLGRLMEPLSAHLAQRDRGAAVLHVRLRLVTKDGTAKAVHARSLELPAPMREARTLRTLALLDLESHPPAAAIECVTVAVDPTPARVVQYSLLARPLPAPEQLSTLLARLHAVMGESRCGSPATVDTWRPGAFALTPFAPVDPATTVQRVPRTAAAHEPQRHREHRDSVSSVSLWFGADDGVPNPVTALRRFRRPVPARVQLDEGKPARIVIDRRGLKGGPVATCAGPWRTSGAWWTGDGADVPWDRDEWDVLLEDGATYRLFRERAGNHWFVDGVVD